MGAEGAFGKDGSVMRAQFRISVAAVAVGAMLAASPMAQAQDKDLFGALLGGIGGAVAGAQFGKGTGKLAATAAGTLLGAGIGHSVGQSLNRADSAYYGRSSSYGGGYAPTYYDAPPRHYRHARPVYGPPVAYYPPPAYAPPAYYGAPVTYAAPAQATSLNTAGRYCREYQSTVTVGGQPVPAYGTACMQPDGSWEMGPLQAER
jgi:surface antigen